ncbi:MAG TPA: SDR family NAD(P)-dependent oxidoreductase [Sphingobium sp.]|uniref:SDR family NAD(P)-dependent oxidoreductase n=1 Tax=Sphingobium sp. TaxID=1912891 RepID=UPI002ED4F779
MDLQLQGKKALVTGSSSGIGRGIALVLAREGVTIVVHGRNAERAGQTAQSIRDAGGTAHVAIGDLATDDGATKVIAAVEEHLGSVDILVNNIGGNESAGGGLNGWFNDTPTAWTGTMQQNLVAPVRMIHAFVPGMRERKWGRIVNISSGGGTQPTPQAAAYCAAKSAVLNLTVSLSIELARSGVTVNTVSPGCTRTEAFERTLGTMAAKNGWPDDYESREAAFMDLGLFPCSSERYGRPEDIGALVAFLSSPLATFITGANYRIDGGQCQSIN